ncbi:hypothetical protein SAMN05421730_104619, partial [Anaerobium acetethylicum]
RPASRGMQETTPFINQAALTLSSGGWFDVYITTNMGFEEWAEFPNHLSYRCDRIQIAGKSYRLENRKSFLESRGVDDDES